jgi:N-methylhydantoinase B
MRLHFESPPQVRARINMRYAALLSTVYYAVKAVVDPTILLNSKRFRANTEVSVSGKRCTIRSSQALFLQGKY